MINNKIRSCAVVVENLILIFQGNLWQKNPCFNNSHKATVARNLEGALLLLKGTINSKYRAPARASVARNLKGALLSLKGTINSKFLGKAEASVARNLKGALLSLKGTVK